MNAHATFAPRSQKPLTELGFCAWLGQAMPGDRLIYHEGFLILDTFTTGSRLSEQDRRRLTKLQARALWAAEQGLAHLIQQRTGPEQFAYAAIARPKPKGAADSLSRLLEEEMTR